MARPLKVLFANRQDCMTKRGGDTEQMLNTKAQLESQFGLEIAICLRPEEINQHPDASIVHVFNLQTIDETLQFMKAARQNGQKIALSTIYWDMSHASYINWLFKTYGMTPQHPWASLLNFKKLSPVVKKMVRAFNQKPDKRIQALLNADILLPNSPEELSILGKAFSINCADLERKSYVIPNAFEQNNLNIGPEATRSGVIQVGRIEPTKNQLNVLRALMPYPEIPILFIGRAGNQAYFDSLKRLAERRGNVKFIEEVPYEAIFQYYQQAKVHLLPSFRESPGLASLEALFSGCQIVVSSEAFCPVQYYGFHRYGHPCNPYHVKSIRQAILKAYHEPMTLRPSPEEAQHFSYETAAQMTYQAYQSLLS